MAQAGVLQRVQPVLERREPLALPRCVLSRQPRPTPSPQGPGAGQGVVMIMPAVVAHPGAENLVEHPGSGCRQHQVPLGQMSVQASVLQAVVKSLQVAAVVPDKMLTEIFSLTQL